MSPPLVPFLRRKGTCLKKKVTAAGNKGTCFLVTMSTMKREQKTDAEVVNTGDAQKIILQTRSLNREKTNTFREKTTEGMINVVGRCAMRQLCV